MCCAAGWRLEPQPALPSAGVLLACRRKPDPLPTPPARQVLHCCAVIAPNQDVAFMLSILWTTIQLLLSGFFVNFPEVRPGGWG